jgi:hypothetical protein
MGKEHSPISLTTKLKDEKGRLVSSQTKYEIIIRAFI